jgi:hypothetical protein
MFCSPVVKVESGTPFYYEIDPPQTKPPSPKTFSDRIFGTTFEHQLVEATCEWTKAERLVLASTGTGDTVIKAQSAFFYVFCRVKHLKIDAETCHDMMKSWNQESTPSTVLKMILKVRRTVALLVEKDPECHRRSEFKGLCGFETELIRQYLEGVEEGGGGAASASTVMPS